ESAEVPPYWSAFSTTSTFRPWSAAVTAAVMPPAPEPTTIRSYSALKSLLLCMSRLLSLFSRCRRQAGGEVGSDVRVRVGQAQLYRTVGPGEGRHVIGDMPPCLVQVTEHAGHRVGVVQPRGGHASQQLVGLVGADIGHVGRLV